jgi:predicted HTH transcriptional regulator
MASHEPYRAIAARTAIPDRCYGLERDALEAARARCEQIKATSERATDYLNRIEAYLERAPEPQTSREIARAMKIKLTTCRSAVADLMNRGRVKRAGEKSVTFKKTRYSAAAYTATREDA